MKKAIIATFLTIISVLLTAYLFELLNIDGYTIGMFVKCGLFASGILFGYITKNHVILQKAQ